SIPTALLAIAPDLTAFTVLRIAQGLCMASAFTLPLAYLGEECSAADAGGAFAAYITGNVASNLIGRLISAALVDHLGLAWNLLYRRARRADGANRSSRTLSLRGVARAPCQSAAARGVRHRFLHPVRVHRHVHLRQLRTGASTAVARPHGARLRLFRVPAIGGDDAMGGARRSSLRDAADAVGLALARGRRLAAA